MNTSDIQFVDGVRQMYLPKLNAVQKISESGLRKWLSQSDSFIPVNTSDSNRIELCLYDTTEVIACLANDISRLASAAFETVMSIDECTKDKKFLAWQLVEYYYSAFYSAHGTLKACNLGLTQIDSNMIANIRRRAITLGITLPSYSKGIYCTHIDSTSSKIILFRVSRYDDSHKGLWQRYSDFLGILSGVSVTTNSFDSNCVRSRQPNEPTPLCVYSQLPSPDSHRIIAKIDEIKNTLNKKGDNNWLSFMRNSINYNHAFGVWYPFKTFNSTFAQFAGFNHLFIKDPLNTDLTIFGDTELHEFIKCCQSINSINYAVLCDLSQRHPESKSFLRTGPLEYVKLHT
jgi:hypothetical protein